MTDYIPEVTDNDIYITRSFDAPVAVVWKFWTQADLLAQWFGPHAVTVDPSTVTVEAREGGAWDFDMNDVDGVYPVRSTLVKVVENEYLEGELVGAVGTVRLRVQFHDHGDKTRITLHQGPIDTAEFRDATRAGWLESFEKIDAIIAGGAE